MKNSTLAGCVVPILMITVGIGWFLTAKGIGPGINWVWTLGLAMVGILSLVGGLDKVSVVLGPSLLIASILSVLRQTDQLSVDLEVPLLVIVLGVFLLVARLPAIPIPAWAQETGKKGAGQEEKPPQFPN